MFLIRDIFHCKPGQADKLAQMFKNTIPSMEQDDGFRNCQIMVDFVARYWTVVVQTEVNDLEKFEMHMISFRNRPEVKNALAGYMDLVQGGEREIYWLV